MRRLSAVLAVIASLSAGAVRAHEFWIAPLAYAVPVSESIVANLVNGEAFDGVNLPFLPRGIVNAVQFSGDQAAGITGRTGDSPALAVPPIGEGLAIIAYQAANAVITYDNWDDFQAFVDHKDLGDLRSQHQARGLAEQDFAEVYGRYAKSLIAVGDDPAGADRRVGLETELVALTNPYTDDLADGMAVQLYYRNDVRADAQIEIFRKAPDGTVEISLIRTDAAGIARFPVLAGHEYMLDAVVLRQPSDEVAAQTGAVWQTLWANLTFMVP